MPAQAGIHVLRPCYLLGRNNKQHKTWMLAFASMTGWVWGRRRSPLGKRLALPLLSLPVPPTCRRRRGGRPKQKPSCPDLVGASTSYGRAICSAVTTNNTRRGCSAFASMTGWVWGRRRVLWGSASRSLALSPRPTDLPSQARWPSETKAVMPRLGRGIHVLRRCRLLGRNNNNQDVDARLREHDDLCMGATPSPRGSAALPHPLPVMPRAGGASTRGLWSGPGTRLGPWYAYLPAAFLRRGSRFSRMRARFPDKPRR